MNASTSLFFQAFNQSDWLGKAIFLSLLLLSVGSWTLIIHKILFLSKAQKNSQAFEEGLKRQRNRLLQIESPQETQDNPFLQIYLILKKQAIELLAKNRHFAGQRGEQSPPSSLSPRDIDFVEAHVLNEIENQAQLLERHLYLLSTVTTLAPFLGLLGTVWGILSSFSEMQARAGSNQAVLGGLALALTTTVIGLLIAIPALIGYNWLKNRIRSLQSRMSDFSFDLLASIELQYRQADSACRLED